MSELDIKRKLATILVADIVEFSRLTAQDEDWTIRALADFRKIVDEIISRHEGRIFSTGGDSVLAEFASPVEAVRAAVDFQEAARSRNLLQPRERQLRFRMGINLGDVMVHGSDLLGDGVNVAARLQALSEPGGICVSGTVWDQINGKLSLGYVDLGEQSIRNIPRPVRAYRLRLESGVPEEVALPPAEVLHVRNGLVRRLIMLFVPAAIILGALVWQFWPMRSPLPSTPNAAATAEPARGRPADRQMTHGFRPGQSFQDCRTCPEMIVLPAGRFLMGAAAADHERVEVPTAMAAAEKPQHPVMFAKPFALGKYDITRSEFAAFVNATQFHVPPGCGVFSARAGEWQRQLVVLEEFNWQNPSYPQTDRDPVVCVNTSDIEAYVRWLRSETGRPYRLPTDAEWEYAARGNTATLYYWGDNPDEVCLYENVFDETAKQISNPDAPAVHCRDGYGQSAPVGSFKPNPFGLYDVAGNVSVLIEDCWNPTYQNAPSDGSAWRSGDCTRRVARKTSFSQFEPWGFRSSTRFSTPFSLRHSRIGFRVAVSIE